MGVEMAAFSGIDLHRASAGRADALGIMAGLLIAFDHGNLESITQRPDRFYQKRRLARAGARDQIEGEDPALLQRAAVLRRVGIVLRQDVLLDSQHARGRQPWRVRVNRPGTAFKTVRPVHIAMPVTRRSLVIVIVAVQRTVGVTVRSIVRVAFDPDFA